MASLSNIFVEFFAGGLRGQSHSENNSNIVFVL